MIKNHGLADSVDIERVIIFGDSIALGVDARKSWPQLLLEKIPEPFQLYNLSISGETTTELVKRARDEFLRRFKPEKTIVLIQHAHNDFWESKKRKPDMGKSLSNFKTVFDSLEAPIICISPVWIPEHKKGERIYRSDLLEIFVDKLENLCSSSGVTFIDVFSQFKNRRSYYTETWHLNARGNEVIAEIVKNSVVGFRL